MGLGHLSEQAAGLLPPLTIGRRGEIPVFGRSGEKRGVKVSSKVRLNLDGKTVSRYPILILKGWSYDFDYMDTTSESVLNLNPVTFYFKPENPLITEDTVSPKSELKDVTRL